MRVSESTEPSELLTHRAGERDVAEVRRVTWIGMALNLVLALFKMITGVLGNSYSVLADGVHSLSDCGTDIAILIGVRYWSEPPDEKHPHGHRRIETVVTICIGLTLTIGAVLLGFESMVLLQDPSALKTPSLVAAIAALVSIVVKEGLFRWTMRVGTRHKSAAVVANAWHHRSDAFSSIPAVIGVGVAVLFPGWQFLDLVGGGVVSVFILYAGFQIAWPALTELVDSGASEKDCAQLMALVQQVDGVRDVHDLRTRYLGSALQVDLHVMVDPDLTVLEGHEIAHHVEDRLLEQGPSVVDVLVHVEPYGCE